MNTIGQLVDIGHPLRFENLALLEGVGWR